MSPQKKKKVIRVILAVGLLFLILGLIPGFFRYWVGIVIFIFSLVATGYVKIVVPEPEHAEPKKENQEQQE